MLTPHIPITQSTYLEGWGNGDMLTFSLIQNKIISKGLYCTCMTIVKELRTLTPVSRLNCTSEYFGISVRYSNIQSYLLKSIINS